MIKDILNIFKSYNSKGKKIKGFSLVEVLVSLAIFSMILLAMFLFLSSMNNSNDKTKADREALENARRALEEITHEIRSAESIYTPTTTGSQLSLQTSRYLPAGEKYTYIDFFLCGDGVCIKKESQSPIILTSNSVKVTNLEFSQISNGYNPSVQVSLIVSYPNLSNNVNSSSINLTSAASLRSY